MPEDTTTTAQNRTPAAGQPPNQPANGAQSETPAPETWDAWLGTLPEDQRGGVTKLYDAQTQGLKTALDSERDERKRQEKKVRDLAAAAEKGSDSEKQLTEMADSLAAANRRAEFFQEAAKPEIGLADPELAWLRINAAPDEFTDRKGNINFDALKARHPALFRQVVPATPKGNAGAGTGQELPKSQTMNDMLRGAAGYRP